MEREEQLSVGRLYRALAQAFRERGLATPELDARVLVSAACELSREAFALHQDRPVRARARETAEAYRQRRLDGEPVSRILGEREFWGLPFRLNAHVLDPRADTETLVAAVLELAAEEPRNPAPLSILDLGTGTGCVLLSLLNELPLARGIGCDRDWHAVRTAQDNAARIGVESRARFFRGSWLDAVSATFDFVVSNPPYIRSGDIADLPVEVAHHDPYSALDGGADGLAAYTAISMRSDDVLAPGGWALFEVGAGQAQDVIDILEPGFASSPGFEARVWCDLAGIERCVGVRAGKPGQTPRKRG